MHVRQIDFDSDDYDDYLALQRDLRSMVVSYPSAKESDPRAQQGRPRPAGRLRRAGPARITDEEVEAATYAHSSEDMPPRQVQDTKAAQEMRKRDVTGTSVAKALAKRGYRDVAEAVLNIQKQRVSGDYLHTSAILDPDFNVIAAVNDLNDYAGPGTGYRLEGERWAKIADIRHAIRPEDI